MAPTSMDFKVDSATQHHDEPVSEAQNFDLEMPDMSKVIIIHLRQVWLLNSIILR